MTAPTGNSSPTDPRSPAGRQRLEALQSDPDRLTGALSERDLAGTHDDAHDSTVPALVQALAAARREVDNLKIAVATNRDIGVAVGVLMAAHKIPREQAFDLLHVNSQRSNRKVRDVAAEVISAGALPGDGDSAAAAAVYEPALRRARG